MLETAIRDAGFDAEIATVTTFDGLTVETARANGARWLVAGFRAISDFEAEGQCGQQRAIAEDIDTVFFASSTAT